MRLSPETIQALADAVGRVAPSRTSVRLFGSRLDDSIRGGDVDLMVEFQEPVEHPALLAARIAVSASRAIEGRQVDVVLKAPNLLESSIHRVAAQRGIEI